MLPNTEYSFESSVKADTPAVASGKDSALQLTFGHVTVGSPTYENIWNAKDEAA